MRSRLGPGRATTWRCPVAVCPRRRGACLGHNINVTISINRVIIISNSVIVTNNSMITIIIIIILNALDRGGERPEVLLGCFCRSLRADFICSPSPKGAAEKGDPEKKVTFKQR